MQPKHLPMYQRMKYEPTRKKVGKSCRLYGKDFRSIAEAARFYGISWTWAREQINNGRNTEAYPERTIHGAKWKAKLEGDTSHG